MSELQLRDHSQPCEHEDQDILSRLDIGHSLGVHRWCPGGREVTIDYKAAEAMFKKFWDRPFGSVHSDLKMATAAVDAALGGSDE